MTSRQTKVTTSFTHHSQQVSHLPRLKINKMTHQVNFLNLNTTKSCFSNLSIACAKLLKILLTIKTKLKAIITSITNIRYIILAKIFQRPICRTSLTLNCRKRKRLYRSWAFAETLWILQIRNSFTTKIYTITSHWKSHNNTKNLNSSTQSYRLSEIWNRMSNLLTLEK